MIELVDRVIFFTSFVLIALASRQVGDLFARLRLPKISGYLFTGLLAGPFVLGLASEEAVSSLLFIDEISLAYIAFAAGSELYLPELRARLRSIGVVAATLIASTLLIGGVAVFLLADFVPFMQDFGVNGRIAIALLAAAIMVARSPSVAIAVVNELRARGPFTQLALGVTIISDIVVIVLFAISASIADALLNDVSINLGLLALLAVELALSVVIGFILSRILHLVLALKAGSFFKSSLILALGYGVYLLSAFVREYSHANWPFEILLEPLLIAMSASFILNNTSKYRTEFVHILHDMGPLVYIAFFTLVGEELKLEILVQVWPIALALFAIRAVSIILGSFAGGVLSGEPMVNNRLKWMVFVTQAGVALGLAKEVGVEFPGWGEAFATTVIAAVVLNEIAGPLLFKAAINRVGEAHTRAQFAFDGVRDVIIFGVEGQAAALARQLQGHGWDVRMACLMPSYLPDETGEVDVRPLTSLSVEAMQQLDMQKVDAIVCMLSDEENYRICEIAYEQFGTETMVVRLNDLSNVERFRELGALIVEPGTAMVGLLEQFVRSPATASMLLGMDTTQEVMEVELRDTSLDGLAVRDLRLPLETLLLSVRRNGQTIVTHGYTRLELGDRITLMGPQAQLREVMARFDG